MQILALAQRRFIGILLRPEQCNNLVPFAYHGFIGNLGKHHPIEPQVRSLIV